VAELHDLLGEKRVTLTASWEGESDDEDPFALRLPVLVVATKADELSHPQEELATFRELTGYAYPAVTLSATSGQGLEDIGPFLFEHLGVVRVYTKVPGSPPDTTHPFTVRRGQTVGDVATLIHKELVETLRFARLWRDGFEGGQVGRDHPVQDGDVLELHTH
jgi:ribosome-interacting GTPase 1